MIRDYGDDRCMLSTYITQLIVSFIFVDHRNNDIDLAKPGKNGKHDKEVMNYNTICPGDSFHSQGRKFNKM